MNVKDEQKLEKWTLSVVPTLNGRERNIFDVLRCSHVIMIPIILFRLALDLTFGGGG